MARLFFYIAVVLVMPYLTVLLVHHGVGGLAPFVGFGAALACVVMATVLAQISSILVKPLRLMRKLAGGSEDLDTPPTGAEKLLLCSGPFAVALFVYGATGAVLAYWARMDAVIFIVLMLGLGCVYGGLMSYGLLRQLVDVQDM